MSLSVAGHSLLSDQAKRLDVERELPEHTQLALELLELDGLGTIGSEDIPRLKRIVVRQINYQLKLGLDGLVFSSQSRGSRSEVFKNTLNPQEPFALLLAGWLRAKYMSTSVQGDWPTVGSKRDLVM